MPTTALSTGDAQVSSRLSIISTSNSKKATTYRLCDPKYFETKARNRKEFPKEIRHYYKEQSTLLRKYDDDRKHLAPLLSTKRDAESSTKEDRISLESRRMPQCDKERALENATIFVNLSLLIGKAVATSYSGSLAIFSSLIDSVVDMATGVVIFLSNRAIRTRDPYHYPRGRTRLEPLGLVIVSVIMGIASLQVIVKTMEAIVADEVKPKMTLRIMVNETEVITKETDWRIVGIMISTIVLKFVLMIVCYCIGRQSATIMVLAQDHRNDCISNSVALTCGYLGSQFWNHIDSICAILVSVYIAGSWIKTGYHQISVLSGRSAPPYFISRVIKVCLDHDEEIQHVDAVLVYHFGTQFIVEVDIVLDKSMSVKRAHDISEPLQRKIEHLPDVERAFVHVDYQTKHTPSYEHKAV